MIRVYFVKRDIYFLNYKIKPAINAGFILFEKNQVKPTVKPVYEGLSSLKDFYKDYLAYQVNLYAENDPQKALLLVVSLIIILFLLINIFGYLAIYFMVFLRNGVVRDLRNKVYKKE